MTASVNTSRDEITYDEETVSNYVNQEPSVQERSTTGSEIESESSEPEDIIGYYYVNNYEFGEAENRLIRQWRHRIHFQQRKLLWLTKQYSRFMQASLALELEIQELDDIEDILQRRKQTLRRRLRLRVSMPRAGEVVTHVRVPIYDH